MRSCFLSIQIVNSSPLPYPHLVEIGNKLCCPIPLFSPLEVFLTGAWAQLLTIGYQMSLKVFRANSPTLNSLLFFFLSPVFCLLWFRLSLCCLSFGFVVSYWMPLDIWFLGDLGRYRVRRGNKSFQWSGLLGKCLFKMIISYSNAHYRPGTVLTTFHEVFHLILTTLW